MRVRFSRFNAPTAEPVEVIKTPSGIFFAIKPATPLVYWFSYKNFPTVKNSGKFLVIMSVIS